MRSNFFTTASLLTLVWLTPTTATLEVESASPPDRDPKPQRRPQVTMPATVAGRLTERWLRAFNSGDYEAIRAFYVATSPPASVDADVAYAYAAYLDSRGFDLVRIEQATEYEIRFLAKERVSEEWTLLRVRYEEKEPYRQTVFGIRYVYAPADFPSEGRMSAGEIARRLNFTMNKLAAADVYSGAVLVAKDDKVIFKKAYGLANKAFGIPNHTDTKFNIGSITKVFTALAVLQLVERGKLSLDDTIGRHLSDYPNKAVSEKVTIHHLLTHTSGLGRAQSPLGERGNALRLRTVASWLPLFVDRPPLFDPGSSWRYSNEGYIVLGAIIEKVSGQSYFDYVKEHVFKSAGMGNTDFYELDSDTPNMATGYTRNGLTSRTQLELRTNNLLLTFVKGTPEGGAYSTVDDLLKFKIALFSDKLLTPEYTKQMLTGKVETGEAGSRQAYGFADEMANGVRLVLHSGAVAGGEARFEIYPELGYTVISLTNYDYQVVHRRLRDMITRK